MRSKSKNTSKAAALAALLAAVLSIITACGATGQASGFSATTLDGDEFNLAEKRGEVVALYFMAGY